LQIQRASQVYRTIAAVTSKTLTHSVKDLSPCGHKSLILCYPFGGQDPIRQFCLEQNWSNYSSPEGHAPRMAHDSGHLSDLP
jgi:hypothetical protein